MSCFHGTATYARLLDFWNSLFKYVLGRKSKLSYGIIIDKMLTSPILYKNCQRHKGPKVLSSKLEKSFSAEVISNLFQSETLCKSWTHYPGFNSFPKNFNFFSIFFQLYFNFFSTFSQLVFNLSGGFLVH